MFWNKQTKESPLLPHREECNRMAAEVIAVSGVDFNQASTLEQALIGTFVFGMVQTHGMMNNLQPPDIHAVSLCVFQDTLHYTAEAAAQGVQESINATDPKYHETMHAILHRGIDGHKQYLDGNTEGLKTNIQGILNHFKTKG